MCDSPDKAYRLAQEIGAEFAGQSVKFVVCLTRDAGRRRAQRRYRGLAVMDMVVGRAMYDRALALGLGTEVGLGG